jgi:hypothetical protein
MLKSQKTKKKRSPGELLSKTVSLDDFNQALPDQDVSLQKAIYACNVQGDNNQTINIHVMDDQLQAIMRKLEEISHNVLSINHKGYNL